MFSDPEVARAAITVTLVNVGLTLFLAVGAYALARGLLNVAHRFAEKHLFRERPEKRPTASISPASRL